MVLPGAATKWRFWGRLPLLPHGRTRASAVRWSVTACGGSQRTANPLPGLHPDRRLRLRAGRQACSLEFQGYLPLGSESFSNCRFFAFTLHTRSVSFGRASRAPCGVTLPFVTSGLLCGEFHPLRGRHRLMSRHRARSRQRGLRVGKTNATEPREGSGGVVGFTRTH